MEINNNESTIDLRKFLDIAKEKKIILIAIIAICTIIAIIAAFVLPKQYSSSSMVKIKSTSDLNNIPVMLTNIASQLGVDTGNADGNSPETYIEVMKSRAVVEPIIEDLDLSEEAKEKMTIDGFIKSHLELTNVKKTDLINITAYGKTPEEAQKINQGLIDSFENLVMKIKENNTDYALEVLREKVDQAKMDVTEAEDKLSSYQQEKNIYAPDEQVKAIIDSLNSYDKAIAQLQAEADGDNAKLAGVTGQLEQQNAALLEYKVSDNANVGNIREAIVNKRVELVGLEQRFTDEHPDVIRAKEELNSLNESLSKEINNAISSQSVTLSPVQSSLLQSKLETETKIAVDNASLEALKAKEAEAQTSIANLTNDNVEYARLLRDAKMKGEIYTTLVKYYEQSKINESNKAMNIQIISEPDLAREDMPIKPNKKIIIAIGFVLGIMISAGYMAYIYSRRYGL